MARRSIGDAVKVFLAVFALGPPIGGISVIVGLLAYQWYATVPREPVLHALAGLGRMLVVTVPVSYYVGAMAAGIAGLALAAYVAWGYRFTFRACLLAAWIYPLGFAIRGLLTAGPETLPAALTYSAVIAAASTVAASICYLLLRNTAFVRGLNAPGA